ncbi:MAG: hypothetical protein ACRCVN_04525 [Spirochaetia bacterium]
MFENIIGQEAVVSLLEATIVGDQLPPALLFYGPQYSGKLTVALELSRILTCKEDARWTCLCAHCQAQRELAYPYTLMLGNRYFDQEIQACQRTFLSQPNRATYYLFIRSIRKLLRRFDNFLWEDDDQRYRKAKSLIMNLGEILADFEGEDFEKMPVSKAMLIDKMMQSAQALSAILSGYHISIGQVRALRSWCMSTSWEKRVVIIEDADRMNESARNALLKILEEPPADLYFILIAPQRSALIPTLLSRLRSYQFLDRTKAQEQEIIERVFRQEEKKLSLGTFFGATNYDKIQHLVEEFYAGMQNSLKFSDVYSNKLADENFEYFLTLLSEKIRLGWKAGVLSIHTAEDQLRALSQMKRQYVGYRQNPQTLLENFFFRYFGHKN